MATTVVNAAASAPADQPTPNFNPETFTPEEHAAWMDKGTVPTVPAEKPDQAKPADTPPAPPAGAARADEPATESAPVKTQEHKGKGADARKAELNAEIQELLKKRNELRAEVQPKPDAKPDPSPAAKLEKPVKPVFGEKPDETWDQFEARQDAYHEALAEYKAKQILADERAANEKARKDAETAEANKALEESWKERVSAAESKHADFAEVAFSETTPITPAMDGFILDSPVGPEILYRLGQNGSAEGKRIAALGPFAAVRELVKIEQSIAQSLATATAEAPPATPVKAPVTPITRAAKPATDLRATQAAPVDPLKAAIEAGDYTAYAELANRRDIERRRQR